MRIDGAGSDSREVLETAETARALQSAHVNRGVAQHFAGRAAVRSREEPVGKFASRVGNDRHDRGEVYIEPEHPQHFTGYPSQHADTGQITVLAQGARRGHGRKYLTQTINQA